MHVCQVRDVVVFLFMSVRYMFEGGTSFGFMNGEYRVISVQLTLVIIGAEITVSTVRHTDTLSRVIAVLSVTDD